MHWGLKSLPMLGAVVLLSAADVSANGMRCDNKLVQLGDSAYEVKSLCGPPDDMQQRTEQRRVARAVERPCTNSPTGRCAFVVEDVIQVVIDEWTYDFGPQRFVQFLTFEAGKLLTVKSGGYGHKR